MLRFDRFTERAQDSATRAYQILQRYSHSQIDSQHMLLALLEQPDGPVVEILSRLDADVEAMRDRLEEVLRASAKAAGGDVGTGQIFITPRTKRIIDLSNEEATQLHDEYISTEHIFLGILSERNTVVAKLLQDQDITRERVLEAIEAIRGGQRVTTPYADTRGPVYLYDLTGAARAGELTPIFGRDREVLRMIQILSRPNHRNIAIVGEPGVGRRGVIERLCQRIADREVPDRFLKISVQEFRPNAGSATGARPAQNLESVEERLKLTLDQVGKRDDIMLFFKDFSDVLSSEGQYLRQAIGHTRCTYVAMMTPAEYQELIQQDPLLEPLFTPLVVQELSREDTIELLYGWRGRCEQQYRIAIGDSAIEAAIPLSDKIAAHRLLPDKAIDLLDEAASRLRIQLDSAPSALRTLRERIQKLRDDEEAAGIAQDYERAAAHKVERLRLEEQFEHENLTWLQAKDLNDVLEATDVEAYVQEVIELERLQPVAPSRIRLTVDTSRTVFISYRRSLSRYLARAVFMHLREHGYDVFMDVESIDSGQFDQVILNQIAARAHFIIILSHDSLAKCDDPNDWLRREIEHAILLNRNVVPLLEEGFTFEEAEPHLTGQLQQLARYNSLRLFHDYFEDAMDKLRNRFLKRPDYGDIVPAPADEQAIVDQKIARAVDDE
ncbi:MAG: TIR domain-containing protein [Anaerolineae bacterium]|nr:TIR domain-containing protein [Anaerolineae bacterium]